MAQHPVYKGNLAPIVLQLLSVHPRMYGYEITQQVRLLTQNQLHLTEGALYPTLHKLEAEGLLEVETLHVDNRLRKYYRLSEKGQRQQVNNAADLRALLQLLQQLLGPEPQMAFP